MWLHGLALILGRRDMVTYPVHSGYMGLILHPGSWAVVFQCCMNRASLPLGVEVHGSPKPSRSWLPMFLQFAQISKLDRFFRIYLIIYIHDFPFLRMTWPSGLVFVGHGGFWETVLPLDLTKVAAVGVNDRCVCVCAFVYVSIRICIQTYHLCVDIQL